MKKITIYCFALTLSLGISSCKKDSNTTTPTPPANNPPTVTSPSDAWGIMGVVKVQATYTTPAYPGVPSMNIDYNIGTGLAAFGNAVGSSTFVDAGSVKVNDSVLTKLSNNGYAFSPTGVAGGDDIGLNTGSYTHYWNVSGSSSVTGLSYAHYGYLPTVGTITNSSDVQTGSSFTLNVNSISNNCDSIIWVVAGPNGSVHHTTGPGVYSYTFSASEMGSLGKGDNLGLVQVAPYFLTPQVINSKKYYFLKESCATKYVNLK